MVLPAAVREEVAEVVTCVAIIALHKAIAVHISVAVAPV